jgi:hypothetical protein
MCGGGGGALPSARWRWIHAWWWRRSPSLGVVAADPLAVVVEELEAASDLRAPGPPSLNSRSYHFSRFLPASGRGGGGGRRRAVALLLMVAGGAGGGVWCWWWRCWWLVLVAAGCDGAGGFDGGGVSVSVSVDDVVAAASATWWWWQWWPQPRRFGGGGPLAVVGHDVRPVGPGRGFCLFLLFFKCLR